MKTECLSLDMANLIKKCPDFTSLRELSAFFHRNTKVNGSNYYFTLCLEEKDAGEAPNILKKTEMTSCIIAFPPDESKSKEDFFIQFKKTFYFLPLSSSSKKRQS